VGGYTTATAAEILPLAPYSFFRDSTADVKRLICIQYKIYSAPLLFSVFSSFFLSHLNWVFSWGEKLYIYLRIVCVISDSVLVYTNLTYNNNNNNNITYDDDDDDDNNNMYDTYGYVYTTRRRGSPRYMLLYHIILLLLLLLLLFSVTGGNRSNDTHKI